MKTSELWATARRRLVTELGCSIAGDVLFVDDGHVRYEIPDTIRVSRSDLFGLEDHARWAGYLKPRPTWIHFNLLTVDSSLSVVTLRRSDRSMSASDERSPPVNVSAEPTQAQVE